MGVWREGVRCYWQRGGGADRELGCGGCGGEEGEDGFLGVEGVFVDELDGVLVKGRGWSVRYGAAYDLGVFW